MIFGDPPWRPPARAPRGLHPLLPGGRGETDGDGDEVNNNDDNDDNGDQIMTMMMNNNNDDVDGRKWSGDNADDVD